MTMSSGLRIRRLSSCMGIVAIVLLATAAVAQAKGEWKIAEQTMTALEAPEASISGTATETFKLSVAWYASEIECSTLATEAPTKIFPEGTSEAILKLSSCQVLGPPFVSETCKVVEPIKLEVVGELLLHSTKTYELFEAPAGKTSLGAIKFKEGTECPLPLSNELKGTFVGETEAGERKEQPLTFNSTIESLFGSDSLSFGTHPATLKGKSTWALAAGYKGLKWAAVGEEEEWVLDGGVKLGNGELHLELSVTGLGGEILITPQGEKINCTAGTSSMKLTTNSDMTVLTGSGEVSLTGCTVLGFSKCTVKSSGQPVGTIKMSDSGVAVMSPSGTAVEILAESKKFTELLLEGGMLCPFEEFTGGLLEGSMKLSIADAAELKETHSPTLDDVALFYAEEAVNLHASGEPSNPITGSAKKIGGGNWAIKLIE